VPIDYEYVNDKNFSSLIKGKRKTSATELKVSQSSGIRSSNVQAASQSLGDKRYKKGKTQ
jgi:hypothetical protein